MTRKDQLWENRGEEGCRHREQVLRFGRRARASQGKRGKWGWEERHPQEEPCDLPR